MSMWIKNGTMEEMLQEERQDFTKDGHCSDCGSCCSNLLPISDREVERIRKYIKKNGIKAQTHVAILANQALDMMCPFMKLRREKKCTIYPVRPQICRAFVCNKTAMDAAKDPELYREPKRIRDIRQTFYGGAK